ncbi:MAG: hypothetical protein H6943_10135 [Zoogloeaceae bacterium]|nr:hypothetical protein [Zoogloeaceae bacterium]
MDKGGACFLWIMKILPNAKMTNPHSFFLMLFWWNTHYKKSGIVVACIESDGST